MAYSPITHRAIYAIICDDGRAYVGGTCGLSRRWSKHMSQLRLGKHHSHPLQEAWDTLGQDKFSFRILEDVPAGADIHEAEQRHIDRLQAYERGFNRCPKANDHTGLVYSDASKARMKAARALENRRGSMNVKALVTEEDVVEIRRLKTLGLNARQIGERYGISRGAASDIILRRNWKHVV